MKLVPDAKDAWRWFSVRLAALSGLLPAAWLSVPEDMREAVPPEWLAIGGIGMAFLIILGRLLDQDTKDKQP